MTAADAEQVLRRLQSDGSHRLDTARREQRHYDDFRADHDLNDDVDAVTLYLTWLLDQSEMSGMQLRYRLRLLDIAAVLDGHPRPSQDRLVRTFLRGLHQEARLGPERNRTPIYPETLRALLDAIDRDRVQQARDVALLLIANSTGLPADVLRQLTWDQVRTYRSRVVVTVPYRYRGRGPSGCITVPAGAAPCTVEAVRDLRLQVGPVNGYLFTRRAGAAPNLGTINQVVGLLPGRGTRWRSGLQTTSHDDLAASVELLSRARPRQLRDRALLTLGFAACLTSLEAHLLRIGDLETQERGLVLQIHARRGPTVVPRRPNPRYCAVAAWEAWRARLNEMSRVGEAAPAFPRVWQGVEEALDAGNLIRIVRDNCARAGVVGDYSFASLRMGFLRAAARAAVPADAILRQAGLRYLHSVEAHQQRERLISHSIAGRLGL